MEKISLSTEQMRFALTLNERHELKIPFDVLHEYEFGKKFIDLFSFDPDSQEPTGLRRVSVIIDYLYYDKDKRHLQFKLDMRAEDIDFMVRVLALYKFDGAVPREDMSDKNPEKSAYDLLEEKLYKDPSDFDYL